jgi:thiamine biosynthesis protein ThiC
VGSYQLGQEVMDCAAIGDSIAVGIGQAAHCTINAKVGASSSYIANHTISTSKDVVVISAGSNDPANPNLKKNLEKIRSKVKANTVVWILPYNRKAAAAVISVANRHGDKYIDLVSVKTNDGVHPSSYRNLVKRIW